MGLLNVAITPPIRSHGSRLSAGMRVAAFSHRVSSCRSQRRDGALTFADDSSLLLAAPAIALFSTF